MIQSEVERYPLTGRFLMGRLRHAMSTQEKDVVESLVEETEVHRRPARLLARGELVDRSTILIEGYVLRTIQQEGQRYVVGLHVPGDFLDLHAFALKRLDHDIVTLGETRVGYVRHERLADILGEAAELGRA